MGELRGRPDTPPDDPDTPAPNAPERARTPDPPTDSNNDPRAIRDAFRRAEDPAFADPRVQVRYVTDRRPDTSPAGTSPYRTAKDRPEPEPEPDRPADLTARTLEVEKPRADNPFETDTVGKNKFDESRKRLWGNVDELCEAGQKAGDKMDDLLGRQYPTGQHTQDRPRETIYDPTRPHGLDGGSTVAAMLATGLALGELTRLAYRKASELKERRNAGHR